MNGSFAAVATRDAERGGIERFGSTMLDDSGYDRVLLATSDRDDHPRVFLVKLTNDVLREVMARAHAVRPINGVDLVERVIREINGPRVQAAEDISAPTGPRRRMLDEVMAYIDAHLEDDDLTPDKVAAGVFISKRYLYTLFEDQPHSVSRHIIVRRLQVVAGRLVDPAYAHLAAADLAMRVGFKDASHFARSFKAQFGLTPGRFRIERRLSDAA